ncbi:hypothetical protein GJ698_22065 [Pseudoduganella sp. FT26W]|uniref:HTH luxR-type domain-containing protein n=1 Tax=Duganella aquatilis TaxID=2666082 RepID=A0A844DEP1_9BURK|nr:hypothetical protein [Duganella aquatilis]MRW86760.1 hypothetical protein [Duganella aquatilis]
MAQLGANFGADSSFMFTSHSETDPEATLLGQNTSLEMIEGFRDYWCQEDIWAAEARRRGWMKRDVVLIGNELIADDELRRSRYYNEFARHYGMEGMLGSVLFDGTESSGIPFTNLCWYRPPGHGNFQLSHKRHLKNLLGHIQQALKIQYKLKALHTQRDDQYSGAASILLSADGRIIKSNALADSLLKSSNGLFRCVNGRLRALGRRSAPAIDEALTIGRACQRPVHLLVQTADGLLLRGVLFPLPVEEESYAGWHDDRHFMLIIDLPNDNVDEIMARAAVLFALSGAEQRLAAALVKGLSLEQIAEARNVSHNTLRTQVRSLLSKTGFTRQIDFVRTMTRLIG